MLSLLLIICVVIIAAILIYFARPPMRRRPEIKGSGEEFRDKLPEYKPYFDIILSYAVFKRTPGFDELVTHAEACPVATDIPREMDIENTARVLYTAHVSQPLHDFAGALGAMFELPTRHEPAICVIADRLAFPISLLRGMFPATIFVAYGWTMAVEGTHFRADKITADVAEAIEVRTAIYFSITTAVGIEHLRDVHGAKILISRGAISEVELIFAPDIYCHTIKKLSGEVTASMIYTPVFAAHRKPRPWAVITRAVRTYDGDSLARKLFYYDLAHRSIGIHTCDDPAQFDQCGDCANMAWWLTAFTNKYGAQAPSMSEIDPNYYIGHVHEINLEQGLYTYVIHGLYNYNANLLQLGDIKILKPTLEEAYAIYQLRLELAAMYGDKIGDRIHRAIDFARMVGFNRISMDNIYLKMQEEKLGADVGSVIANTFRRLPPVKVITKVTGDTITINDATFTRPKCHAEMDPLEYAKWVMMHAVDYVGTYYTDPYFAELINKHKKRSGAAEVYFIGLTPLMKIDYKFDKYFYLMENNIPLVTNALIVFESHSISDAIKHVYLREWVKNHTCVIFTQFHEPGKYRVKAKMVKYTTLSKTANCADKESIYDIGLVNLEDF